MQLFIFTIQNNFAKELLLQWREREGEVGPLVVSDKIMLPHYNHSICLVNSPSYLLWSIAEQ